MAWTTQTDGPTDATYACRHRRQTCARIVETFVTNAIIQYARNTPASAQNATHFTARIAMNRSLSAVRVSIYPLIPHSDTHGMECDECHKDTGTTGRKCVYCNRTECQECNEKGSWGGECCSCEGGSPKDMCDVCWGNCNDCHDPVCRDHEVKCDGCHYVYCIKCKQTHDEHCTA